MKLLVMKKYAKEFKINFLTNTIIVTLFISALSMLIHDFSDVLFGLFIYLLILAPMMLCIYYLPQKNFDRLDMQPSVRSTKWITRFIVFLLLFKLAEFISSLYAGSYLESAAIKSADRYENLDGQWGGVNIDYYINLFLISILICYAFLSKWSKEIFLVVLLILFYLIIQAVISTSRFVLMLATLPVMVHVMLVARPKIFIIYSIIGVVAIINFGLLTLYFRRGGLGIGFGDILHQIAGAASIGALGYMTLPDFSLFDFSPQYSFYFIFKTLGISESRTGIFPDAFMYEGSPHNIFTAARFWIIDFGILGGIIFNSLLCSIPYILVRSGIASLSRIAISFLTISVAYAPLMSIFAHAYLLFALILSIAVSKIIKTHFVFIRVKNP